MDRILGRAGTAVNEGRTSWTERDGDQYDLADRQALLDHIP